MSRFDDLFYNDSFLNKNINDITEIVNKEYTSDKIDDIIEESNKEYYNYIKNRTNQKDFSFDDIKYNLYSKCTDSVSKAKFIVDYFKFKYTIVNSLLLKQFFDDILDGKNELSLVDYKHFIIYHFSKETIDLTKDKEYNKFITLIQSLIE